MVVNGDADVVLQALRQLVEARCADERVEGRCVELQVTSRGLQEEVSARSGVHPTEISRIENGQRDVQITTIFKLAKAFDLTPGQFIDGDLQ